MYNARHTFLTACQFACLVLVTVEPEPNEKAQMTFNKKSRLRCMNSPRRFVVSCFKVCNVLKALLLCIYAENPFRVETHPTWPFHQHSLSACTSVPDAEQAFNHISSRPLDTERFLDLHCVYSLLQSFFFSFFLHIRHQVWKVHFIKLLLGDTNLLVDKNLLHSACVCVCV